MHYNKLNKIRSIYDLLENTLPYLKFQKVIPKENYFDNSIHTYYIYCYLNPFNETLHKYIINSEEITFGFEPLYIGKASTNYGYRHNQHIAEFLKAQDSEENIPVGTNINSLNLLKKEAFIDIENNMKQNMDPNKPNNWTEYQKNWIIILKKVNNTTDLIQLEKEFIKTIGTQIKKTGPLVNILQG